MNRYCPEAVQREILKDPRIKGKEARLIHALLRGRDPVQPQQKEA